MIQKNDIKIYMIRQKKNVYVILLIGSVLLMDTEKIL